MKGAKAKPHPDYYDAAGPCVDNHCGLLAVPAAMVDVRNRSSLFAYRLIGRTDVFWSHSLSRHFERDLQVYVAELPGPADRIVL
jgi:hypothetical protein